MIFCYCNFGGNIGDRTCSPKFYFGDWITAEEFYPTAHTQWKDYDGPIIVGGGGMFQAGMDFLYDRLADSGKATIVWGAGTNLRPFTKPWWVPRGLKRLAAVGIRDFSTEYEYVPCSSCMHSAFDETTSPIHDYMVYAHYDFPIKISAPVSITNNQPDIFNSTRAMLSAKTVITNSYHGAYWAMLLNRRVILFNPQHNKLNYLKYHPELVTKYTWMDKITGEQDTPRDFRDECRDLNSQFYRKIKELL